VWAAIAADALWLLSGFIIVCAALRLLADQGYCVERLLRRFAEQRPPGIYKDEYIFDLFRSAVVPGGIAGH
jgi:hypothetical protein